MDIEHGSTDTIDAKTLIEQSGENMGSVAAVEFLPGHIQTENSEMSPETVTPSAEESHPIIEGLPVIGAEAESRARNEKVSIDATDRIFREKGYFGSMNLNKAREVYYDEAGTEAMIAEITRRADTLVPGASQELRDAIRKQAVENFRNELESKKVERQAIADAEAQTILDKLKAGKSLDELEQEREQEETE